MNQAKAALGCIVLALCTIVSMKIVFFGEPEIKENELLKISGSLTHIGCHKERYAKTMRIQSDSNLYFLKQQPNLLPTCVQAEAEWPIGSQIIMHHTPVGFKPDIYAYKLTVNGKLIFGYGEAIESINESNKSIIGFTIFMWVLIFCIGIFKLYKHNQKHQRTP